MITTSINIEPYLAEYLRGSIIMVLKKHSEFQTIQTFTIQYGH